MGEGIPHTPSGGNIKQARANARVGIGRSVVQNSRKQTANRAIIPKAAVSEHPPTSATPTAVTHIGGLTAATSRRRKHDMRVVARVKTFLGDVRTAPIRSTRVGEFGVIACGIVCILGRVVADIVRAVVPVHTVNPFPHIAPQTLDTSPHDIDLAVRARRSASEIRNTVAGAGFQRTAVAVTVTSTDFALHIVVGELNQHEHLHSGECRNVNQAPTCALALGIGAELRSRLRHLRACAADGLVVGGGLVCADVGVVTLLASMIEQRVNGETSSGLVGDFDILHIPLSLIHI